MERKVMALAMMVMLISIAAAGCLGSEGENSVADGTSEVMLEQKAGQVVEEAWVSGGPAVYEGIDVEHKMTIHLPETRFTYVKFSIQIIDGHGNRESENTNTLPDVLKGDRIMGGSENATGMLNKPIPGGGQNAVVEFRAPEGSYIPCTWEIGLIVTINPSDDQHPGPLFWRGYQDEGFYYIITVDYNYMAEV